jgi:hypothetical protein
MADGQTLAEHTLTVAADGAVTDEARVAERDRPVCPSRSEPAAGSGGGGGQSRPRELQTQTRFPSGSRRMVTEPLPGS